MNMSDLAADTSPLVKSLGGPLRVAFQPFGGAGWLGGIHYLTTLLSALHEHAVGEIEPVLFAPSDIEPDMITRLRPYLARPPVMLSGVEGRRNHVLKPIRDGLRRCNREFDKACRSENIDVAFQHAEWLGSRFSIPTLAWLGDFQHKALPEMFPRGMSLRREVRFRSVLRTATLLYVLSHADRVLGARYYPRSTAKLRALPFTVGVPPEAHERDPGATADKYGVPPKFILFPGQFWKHKNHLAVVEAVWRLKEEGLRATIVSCGNPVDHRDPTHAPLVIRRITELGVGEQFKVLGVIPRHDFWALMRASAAVLNPSLYEGWSTPVEEAKALGAPLLLSDLPVHREQEPAQASFFDPRRPDSLAAALGEAWPRLRPGPRLHDEVRAAKELVPRRQAFAHSFATLVGDTLAADRKQ